MADAVTNDLDDLRRRLAAGLHVPVEDVVLGVDLRVDPKDEDSPYPECLRGIVLHDVNPEDMESTLRAALPCGAFTRACIQVVGGERAVQLRGLDFETAWDLSWDVAVATVRFE